MCVALLIYRMKLMFGAYGEDVVIIYGTIFDCLTVCCCRVCCTICMEASLLYDVRNTNAIWLQPARSPPAQSTRPYDKRSSWNSNNIMWQCEKCTFAHTQKTCSHTGIAQDYTIYYFSGEAISAFLVLIFFFVHFCFQFCSVVDGVCTLYVRESLFLLVFFLFTHSLLLVIKSEHVELSIRTFSYIYMYLYLPVELSVFVLLRCIPVLAYG